MSSPSLIWIDLEMTGLNPDHDRIIEIATVVTDDGLDTVAQGPVLAVHQGEDVLAGMDEWNQRQHQKSGLVERVRASTLDEPAAERLTLDFLRPLLPARASPMCGNSICQDRRFLFRRMPELEGFFHYRNLDVSTLKELAKRWYPAVSREHRKDPSHLALDDIHDSIEELRFYRRRLLVPGSPA